MILTRLFENRAVGFYVDVGAHHPIRLSNTYKFYCRGWSGLNIDATPGSMKCFRSLRPRDINVEAAVGATGQRLTFYEFNEPALNTLSAAAVKEHSGPLYRVIREIPILTESLGDLLSKYVPNGVRIDFMTVDVEGFDYEVLKSNDWERHRPEVILAECLGIGSVEAVASDPLYRLLGERGYKMVAKTVNTVIFRIEEACSD